jgi:anaerobic selenocysteine-containing dehydrogenase
MENMAYLLAFGCSPIEASRNTTRLIRGWATMKGRPDRAKMVVVDPRMSVSAAKADQWLPVNPAQTGAAIAIAHVILTEALGQKFLAILRMAESVRERSGVLRINLQGFGPWDWLNGGIQS